MSTFVTIKNFDDGRRKFNGGKLLLRNAFDKEVIINTISSWKTEPYTEDSSS